MVEIMGQMVDLNEYYHVRTNGEDVYFPKDPQKPVLIYQRKGVGKYNWYTGFCRLGIPKGTWEDWGHNFSISPKGNLVTNAFGPWMPVVGITKEELESETLKELTLELRFNYKNQKPYAFVVKKVRGRNREEVVALVKEKYPEASEELEWVVMNRAIVNQDCPHCGPVHAAVYEYNKYICMHCGGVIEEERMGTE